MNQKPGLNPPTLISEYEVKDAIIKDGVYLMRDMSKIRNAIQLVNNHLFKKYKQNVTLSVVEETTQYDSFNMTYGRSMNDMYSTKYNIIIIVLNKIDESRMSLIKYVKDVFKWIGIYLEESLFTMTASTSSNVFYQSLYNEKSTDGPITINTGFFITSSLFRKKIEFEKVDVVFDKINEIRSKNIFERVISYFK